MLHHQHEVRMLHQQHTATRSNEINSLHRDRHFPDVECTPTQATTANKSSTNIATAGLAKKIAEHPRFPNVGDCLETAIVNV